MKPGDLVEKMGSSNKGHRGIVLEIFTNPVGHTFIKVLQDTGIVVLWFAELVKVINET